MEILGIDIGGSGIKGAPVETSTGAFLAERHRIPTPDGAKPADVARVVSKMVKHFTWQGPVGCCFPASIQHGVARTAANVDKSWIGTNAEVLFAEATGCPVRVINDADAAGLAEMRFGAGKGVRGVVLIVTIGTGLGTALFSDGVLVPNTELGHIEMNCRDAELQASDAARKREDLSWEAWARRFDQYLRMMKALLWPDLIILGGGASKKFDKFARYLTVDVPLVQAATLNDAGIIGAAMAAESLEF
ncbi:MAG TPA: ROK family protein [Anaerolineae bacterium]|nr:ROK family protein [Anaerolineae bacterium]HQK12844.1 ROK family protein [Anaerolineae bacterium]